MICDGGAAIGRTSSSGCQIMQGARGRSSSEGGSSGRPCVVVLPFLSPLAGERNGRDGSFLYSSRDRRIFLSSGRIKWMRHARLVIYHPTNSRMKSSQRASEWPAAAQRNSWIYYRSVLNGERYTRSPVNNSAARRHGGVQSTWKPP